MHHVYVYKMNWNAHTYYMVRLRRRANFTSCRCCNTVCWTLSFCFETGVAQVVCSTAGAGTWNGHQTEGSARLYWTSRCLRGLEGVTTVTPSWRYWQSMLPGRIQTSYSWLIMCRADMFDFLYVLHFDVMLGYCDGQCLKTPAGSTRLGVPTWLQLVHMTSVPTWLTCSHHQRSIWHALSTHARLERFRKLGLASNRFLVLYFNWEIVFMCHHFRYSLGVPCWQAVGNCNDSRRYAIICDSVMPAIQRLFRVFGVFMPWNKRIDPIVFTSNILIISIQVWVGPMVLFQIV